ncbi:MAG: carboxypeptidase regulatory-like domain-containing protein, partial [Clostridia bacterium]|nr:carboxypeptidase regulatory-like domain-containing protein [Clostridia bacterium]
MFKLKRLLSVVTSAAIAASMLSAFSVTAGAFDESISYADGKVTATAAGKLIAASYNESGALAEVKLYDVEADTPIDVEVSEGDKLMLWSGVDGETMVPLTEAYTVEAPAESTDAPTAPPEVESVTYLEEDFNSYSSTGTTAQGTEAQQAELGDVILYVGNRGSGGDGKTGVSLEDGALKIVSERYATSSRGVSIAVNADKVTIPAFGEIEDGAVINYEFKMKFTDSASTVQMMGVTDNTTTPGGQVVNDPYLSVANNSNIPLNEWVSVCVGVDNQKNGTVIIKDADGKLVSTASFTAVGDSLVKFAFYGGITTVYMDDLSIKKAEKAYGSFEGVVKNSDGDAIEDASITVERFKVKTGADGKAAFVLPNGEYDVIASKSGYEHTKGMQDNDTTSVTVNNDVRSAEFELSPMSYDKIPETVNIENGQAFVSAPKTAETNETAAFTVSVFDQYGIKVEDSSEYTLTWDVYPAGTTTADGVVSISEDGVVSVSKDFNPSGDISEYDVTATVVMNNAGLRGQTVKKSIYVGKNDVIYYEPIAWSEAAGARGNTKNLASAVALPDISSVTLDLTMQEPEGQRTLFLVTDTGNFVGIQYQKATSSIVAGTGWSGNSGLNQSGDVDKFT